VTWLSPLSGDALEADTPHSLASGEERWPVVEGVPFLRTGREDLVRTTLAHLDAGRVDDALIGLLADQDDWWTGPTASADDLRELVTHREDLTLRDAMRLLAWGPVADYFAYRWSDPTYLAGLALMEAHWTAPETAFELACGIGHYLRDLTRRGVACLGNDIVFAKCWVAKNWVAPDAEYVAFDAASPWPIANRQFDLAMCHDAFYFLPEKERIAERLRAAADTLLVGHLHNADVSGGAMGPALEPSEWQALFPQAQVYDEDELLAALMKRRAPKHALFESDPTIEAWSVAEGAGEPQRIDTVLAIPPPGAKTRRNPLLNGSAEPHWPSARYREEYARRSYWAQPDDTLPFPADPVRLRREVDLPERW